LFQSKPFIWKFPSVLAFAAHNDTVSSIALLRGAVRGFECSESKIPHLYFLQPQVVA